MMAVMRARERVRGATSLRYATAESSSRNRHLAPPDLARHGTVNRRRAYRRAIAQSRWHAPHCGPIDADAGQVRHGRLPARVFEFLGRPPCQRNNSPLASPLHLKVSMRFFLTESRWVCLLLSAPDS